MELVHKAIKCANCSSILDSPVILPCGHSICKTHENIETAATVRCGACGCDHITPPTGFPENIALSELLKSKIENLDFGDVYKKAKKYCDDLADLHQEIEDLLKNPAHFTHEQISDVRNEIHIKGEEIKLQVDNEMDRLLKKLEQVESDLKAYFDSDEYSIKSKCLENSLKESQAKLDSWVNILNKMTIDEAKWKSINDEGHESYSLVENHFLTFKYDILYKYNIIYRELKYFLNINADIIFQYNYMSIESEIVKKDQCKELGDLLKFSIDCKWSLLYRGSRDGFKAADFHGKCDGKANTLTIVKSSSGNIFGGYTTCEWDQSDSYKSGPADFIFSFRNKFNQRIKINKPLPDLDSIYCSASFGPIFGDATKGLDLLIASCSNQSEISQSNLGASFPHPNLKFGSNEAKSYLAGSHFFKVDEIEVHQLAVTPSSNGNQTKKGRGKTLSFVNPMNRASFRSSRSNARATNDVPKSPNASSTKE